MPDELKPRGKRLKKSSTPSDPSILDLTTTFQGSTEEIIRKDFTVGEAIEDLMRGYKEKAKIVFEELVTNPEFDDDDLQDWNSLMRDMEKRGLLPEGSPSTPKRKPKPVEPPQPSRPNKVM